MTKSAAPRSIREKFVKKFGEDEARRMEKSAESHANGINSRNKGSDPFKWAVLIAIGYECFTKDRYRESHGFTTPVAQLTTWIRNHAELGTHDGDSDYLALFCGAYDEFVKKATA